MTDRGKAVRKYHFSRRKLLLAGSTAAAASALGSTARLETAQAQTRQPTPTVLIRPDDATSRGITNGMKVTLGNQRGTVELTAEIFDGLTWLRYAYRDGLCVYRANHGALTVGLDRKDVVVDAKTMTDNIHYLQRMEASMRRVALDNDIGQFTHHQDLFRQAFVDLRTKLKGRI